MNDAPSFDALRAYAGFLLDHLEEFATHYLRLLRKKNGSLLSRFAHRPEAEMLDWARDTVGDYLREVAAGNVPGTPARHGEDALPDPAGEALPGNDLAGVSATRRLALVQFLPRYTGDPARLVALVEELDEWALLRPGPAFIPPAATGRGPLPGEPAPQEAGRNDTEEGAAARRLYETLDAHLLQKVLDTVPALLYIMEMPSGKTLFINAQVHALLGITPEEMIALEAENVARLIHPEDQPAVVAHHRALGAAADGEVLEIEYRIRHQNGTWRWFRSFETVFRRDPQGEARQLLGNALDVSGRKEAREALREANLRLLDSNNELVRTQSVLREWNAGLDQRVKDRTLELKAANQQIARLLGRERYVRAEAERQKEQLNTLFMQSPALISIVRGPQFRYELANPPYLRAVGATSTLEGKTVHEVIRDLDPAVLDVLDGVYATGKPFVGNEFPITADWQDDGRPYPRYFNLVYEPLRDGTGKVTGIITFGYEVTDQVLARRTVEENERRIRRILDGIPEIIWTANPAGVNTFLNKTWYEYAGATPEGGIHAISHLLIHPHDLDLTRRKWQHSLATGQPFETEYRLRKPTEQDYRWLLARAVPLHNEAGQVAEWVGMATDIHDQRAALEKLAETQRQFQFLADMIPHLVWRTDPEGNHDYFNRRWYDFTGLTYEETKDRGWSLVLHPDDYGRTLEVWQKSLREGTPYEVEYRFRKADGTYRWFLGRALPLLDAAGRVLGWFGTCTDIHDQRLFVEELTSTKRQLETKNEELTRVNVDLDNFVYTASHDLRSPINNLEGLQKVLQKRLKTQVADTEQELLDLMSISIHKLNTTIRELTEIVKVQKELAQEREPIAYQEVFEDVIADLAEPAAEAGASLEVHFDVKEIYYPRKHLRSILLNLLSNAVKYRSPDRPLRITVGTRLDNQRPVLFVTDNGLGIEESKKDRIFDMFRRLHTHVEGSGIGLYMVKRIVENNGGRITVESRKESGSTFTVYF